VQANIGMNGRYDSKTLPFMLCHVVPGGSTMNVMRTMAATCHLKRFITCIAKKNSRYLHLS
jgi:hypothetical protein